jgi:hypothetical protein
MLVWILPMIIITGQGRAFIGTDFSRDRYFGITLPIVNILTQYVKLIYYLRF